MKIIEPSVELINAPNYKTLLTTIEAAGRTCYKSEDKITEGSAEKFVRGIIKRGHEAVIEHGSLTVRFICDRGVSHEIVRHRLAAFCQESTRYCNYGKEGFGGEITVIRPSTFAKTDSTYHMRIKKAGGKIFGAVLSAAEKKAMDMEINRQIVEADRRYADDIDAMVLYTLHVHLGFGKKRLRKFYDAFSAEHDRLIQYYQMPDDYTWLCKEMLKRIGVDVEAWNKERKEPDETEKH